MAAMDGRFSVSLDDIRKVAVPVLRHRISTNFQAQAEGQTTESLIKRLVAEIREPDLPKYERRGKLDLFGRPIRLRTPQGAWRWRPIPEPPSGSAGEDEGRLVSPKTSPTPSSTSPGPTSARTGG